MPQLESVFQIIICSILHKFGSISNESALQDFTLVESCWILGEVYSASFR